MPFRLPGPHPRPWIFVWLALLAPAWAVGYWKSAQMIRWTQSSAGIMCTGLDAYAALAHGLPPEKPGNLGSLGNPGGARTAFLTDVPDPAQAERFFCAQYEATPRPLVWWRLGGPGLERRTLPGTTLIVDIDDPAALEGFLRDLRTQAARQGAEVRQRELAPGLLLVQVP